MPLVLAKMRVELRSPTDKEQGLEVGVEIRNDEFLTEGFTSFIKPTPEELMGTGINQQQTDALLQMFFPDYFIAPCYDKKDSQNLQTHLYLSNPDIFKGNFNIVDSTRIFDATQKELDMLIAVKLHNILMARIRYRSPLPATICMPIDYKGDDGKLANHTMPLIITIDANKKVTVKLHDPLNSTAYAACAERLKPQIASVVALLSKSPGIQYSWGGQVELPITKNPEKDGLGCGQRLLSFIDELCGNRIAAQITRDRNIGLSNAIGLLAQAGISREHTLTATAALQVAAQKRHKLLEEQGQHPPYSPKTVARQGHRLSQGLHFTSPGDNAAGQNHQNLGPYKYAIIPHYPDVSHSQDYIAIVVGSEISNLQDVLGTFTGMIGQIIQDLNLHDDNNRKCTISIKDNALTLAFSSAISAADFSSFNNALYEKMTNIVEAGQSAVDEPKLAIKLKTEGGIIVKKDSSGAIVDVKLVLEGLLPENQENVMKAISKHLKLNDSVMTGITEIKFSGSEFQLTVAPKIFKNIENLTPFLAVFNAALQEVNTSRGPSTKYTRSC